MNKWICYITLLANLIAFDLFGQQTPLYNQYFLNPYLYNPALTGMDNESKAYFLYRNQWASVDGAPETHAFTMDGRLRREKIGLGLSFFNDISNVIGRLNGALSASYTVSLSAHQELSFGMSLMAIQSRIFFDRIQVEDISDPNLLSRIDQRTVAESNIGLSYSLGKMRLGFAADQIFQNEINHENAAQFQSLDFNFVRHYITTAQYRFLLAYDLSITPLFLVRTVQGLPSLFDVNAILDYKDKIWLGLSYRHQTGSGFSLGFEIEEQFVISYTYEIPNSDLRILGANSHEFVFGIRLKRKKSNEKYNNRISRNNKYLEEIRDENQIQHEKIDQLSQLNEKQLKKLESYEVVMDRQKEEIEFLKAQYEIIKYDLDSLKKKEAYQLGKSRSKSGAADYYLVVGAFRKLDNAKLFQKILQREAGVTSRVIQNNRQSWYLIYTEQLADLKSVTSKIKQLEEGDVSRLILGKPWVFKRDQYP